MKNEKLRLGLWGCGGRTNALIKYPLEHDLVDITCCYDIDEEKTKRVAEKFGSQDAHSEEELLNSSDVDAFLISLYPGAHGGALLKALPVGKPIYIEKPIATNWEDYHKLLNASKEYKATVHVGLMHRYCPLFKAVKMLVDQGKIGEMISVTVNWICRLREVDDFPGSMNNWHFRDDTGGELTQHCCHSFDWLRQLGGDFTHISAMRNQLIRKDIPIENTWNINLQYTSGALLNFHQSMNNPRNTEMGWVEGSEGSLEWEWSSPSSIKFYPNTFKKQAGELISIAAVTGSEKTELSDFNEAGFISFLERAKKGQEAEISLKDGLWASLIPLMAQQSAEENQVLEITEAP